MAATSLSEDCPRQKRLHNEKHEKRDGVPRGNRGGAERTAPALLVVPMAVETVSDGISFRSDSKLRP